MTSRSLPLSRRTFLQSTGVALTLPWLEAMTPSGYAAATASSAPKMRMVCMCYGLSLHPEYFFPEDAGKDYKPSKYLEVLKDFRNDFTVFSGMYNPGMESAGGHGADVSYLTGAPGVGTPVFKNTISIDQLVAEKIGLETRLPYVSLSSTLSVSRNGVGVRTPGTGTPSQLYAKMFLDGTPKEVQRQTDRLKQGRSIMDTVLEQAKKLEGKVGNSDRQRLEEYFDSVREVEQRLLSAEDWAKKPKPKVTAPPSKDMPSDGSATLRLWYDMMHLAFQTDSTRLFTSEFVHWGIPPLDGVTYDHHNLSHNGKDPEKIRQLAVVDTDKMLALRDFMAKLKNTKEEGESLLERTMILVGSHMHSGAHAVTNLPMMLVGGHFKHGQHLAFDPKQGIPMSNLHVMMLEQFGIEAKSFGTSTGKIPGLETV